MNKQKLNNYKLNASIHTFSVKSQCCPALPMTYDRKMVDTIKLPRTGSFLTRVNLNKLHGDIFFCL